MSTMSLKNNKHYKKFSGLKLQYKVVIGIVCLSLLWFASGILKKNDLHHQKRQEVIPLVKIEKSTAREKTVYLNLTGITEPLYSVDISPEVSGKVKELFVTNGDKVKKDQYILKIEENDKLDQLNQAKAVLRQRELEHEASQSLNEKGYRSQTQAASSLAALQTAKAAVSRAKINLDNTIIKAPFDGYVDKINVQVGDLLTANKSVVKVVNFDQLIIVVHVAEKDINDVELNNIAHVELPTKESFIGKVSFISKIANPSTRVYRVEIKVDNKEGKFSSQGMTANVRLEVKKTYAHQISASSLSLDETGTVGVKVVDDNNIVSFLPVKIIDDDKEGLWISNAPNSINLITQGHLYVKAGSKVNHE